MIVETKQILNPYREDLVSLNTQDVSKAIVVANSLIISKEFNKKHDNVLKVIESLKKSLMELNERESEIYTLHETTYLNRGREYKLFEMNKAFFMLVTMRFTGKEALHTQTRFITHYQFMEHELLIRKETRHLGITEARKPLTEAIDTTVKQGTFKNFSYGNYTKLVYKHILGTTVKKYKEQHNLPEKANIRDYFTREALEKIHIAESKIAGIIEFCASEDDKVVYAQVKEYLIKNKETLSLKTLEEK